MQDGADAVEVVADVVGRAGAGFKAKRFGESGELFRVTAGKDDVDAALVREVGSEGACVAVCAVDEDFVHAADGGGKGGKGGKL